MTRSLTIDYGDDVLPALGMTPDAFSKEARTLIAVKRYGGGWRVEILSWADSCNQRRRQRVEERGVFVALYAHYEAVTFSIRGSPKHFGMIHPRSYVARVDSMKSVRSESR